MKRLIKRVIEIARDRLAGIIATFLFSVLAVALYLGRDWAGEPVTLIRAWPTGLVAVIVVVLVGWALSVRHYRQRLAEREDPEFLREPWSITDTDFNLRWHLLRKPFTWLHQDLRAIDIGYTEATIDGPFHDLGNCMHRLSFSEKRILDSVCPLCSQKIHSTELGGAPVSIEISALKRVTLEQLQRLNRQGVQIRRGLKSDSLAGGLLQRPVLKP